jgi:long-chain acyl-CoA synthetase
LIQYTGGTTGVSKGAMLSHKNLLANMLQIRRHLEGVVNEGEEIYIAPLPIYHIYAFQFHLLSLPSAGALSVLIPDPRDTQGFVKTLKRFQFTGFLGINTLFASLLQDEEFKALDFSALKSTSSGGMALTDDVAKSWFRVTGCEVCEGFGMTEASPVICANIPSANRSATVGLPLPDTQVKVVDSDGLSLPQGEAGELWVKGPQVMSGYWHRPDETANVLTHDGWLRTGDVAVIETTGTVKIVDRLKDMIIVSGFNVYPNEIDNVLTSHPDIAESAVVGMADDKSGEAIKAFVVAAKEGLTAEAVKDYCREQLTAYKVPKEIIFTDQLPKSNVGKVLRRELQSNHTAA